MKSVKLEEMKKMNKEERKVKINELKIELIKSGAKKTSKTKEIKKAIARLLTIANADKKAAGNK